MTSIDKVAIIWSVVIVAIAVGFVAVNDDTNVSSDILYREKTSDSVSDSIASEQQSAPVTTSIFLQTDRDTYVRNDKIKISGSVNTRLADTPVSLMVFTPDGNVVTISHLIVDDDRNFAEAILVDGPLWEQKGEYLIRAHYGSEENTVEITFDFVAPTLLSDTRNTFTINYEDRVFSINYTITNAKVQDITIDPHCRCLIVKVESHDYSMLTIDLPRDIIDAKIPDGSDDIFFVLMDGIEIPYEEISSDAQSRKIQIKFEKGTSELEIIGTEINISSAKSLDEPNCIDMKRHVMDSDDKMIKCKLDIPSPAETKPLWKEYCDTPGEIGLQDDPIPIQIIKEYVISTDAFSQLEGIENSINVKLPYGGIAVCPWFGGSQGTFDTVDGDMFSFVISFGATTKQFSYWVYQDVQVMDILKNALYDEGGASDIHYYSIEGEKKYYMSMTDVQPDKGNSIQITFDADYFEIGEDGDHVKPRYIHDTDFIAVIDEGQTFVVGCNTTHMPYSPPAEPVPAKALQIFKYEGIVQKEGASYHEFLHKGVFIPYGSECKFPEMIQLSLNVGFDVSKRDIHIDKLRLES